MDEKTFTIELIVSDDLDIEQIWPDGDAPENPTREDVLAVLNSSGSPLRVAESWNLSVQDWNVY